MPTFRLPDDTPLAYAESGQGRPLLLIHGSLCDSRYWSPQMAPLGERHHVLAPSLRRCWPERWDGNGPGYDIATHVDDLLAFIDGLGSDAVNLVGHSRGGHVAFRVALQAPERVRRLVLAEPGLFPDDGFGEVPGIDRDVPARRVREALAHLRDGDIDGGLASFVDGVSGMPIWRHTVPSFKQMARDNANTLFGQARESRLEVSRAELASMKTPILLVGGALTPAPFPALLDLLQAHLPDARRITIPAARHAMNLAAPRVFNEAVLAFLLS